MKKITREKLDELAKVMPTLCKIEQRMFLGGGNGTSSDPYTEAEFDALCNSGQWNGGFVSEWGYVCNDVYIYGNSSNSSSTSQNYYDSFSDYITSLSSTTSEKIAQFMLGQIPVISDLAGFWGTNYGDMTRDIQSELLQNWYANTSSFTVVQTIEAGTAVFSVYDADTGGYITSRRINMFGWYK